MPLPLDMVESMLTVMKERDRHGPCKMKFIDPKIDFAFKKIFGSEDAKDILISLLESLMGLEGDKRIEDVQILDPYLAPKIKSMNYSILDVKCIDQRGIHYVVEMQVQKVRDFLKRIQYNAAKAYVNQIARAKNYPKLNQVIAITISDFTLFDKFEHYVSRHETKEQITGKIFLNDIVHYFVELPKFEKRVGDLDNALDKWIFFIKETGELKNIPEALHEKPFLHAFEKARVANMSSEEFELYEKAGMAITDSWGAIELARDEGKQEGRQEGEGGMLLRLFHHRFRDVPNWVYEKIAKADLPTLEGWSLRFMNAKSLEDVFGA